MLTTPKSNYWLNVAEGSLLDFDDYDKIIVSYSGGKDSLALLLFMIEMDVDLSKVEIWHQHVDGQPGILGLMDWPCTHGYVRATGEHFGIKTLFQWKDGGIEGEMLRHNDPTKGVYYETLEGGTVYLPPSKRAKEGTRLKFPQVSADLSVRWCSAYVKIDVARRVIANDKRFDGTNTLFLTGERREESTARSKYNEVEGHPCSNSKRTVHQWRAVIDWTEDDVWSIIRRHRIIPHPAYELGYGRVSCQHCIFADKDQLASNRLLDPHRFGKINLYEIQFDTTIKRDGDVATLADKGTEFVSDKPAELRELAMNPDYPIDRFKLPAGETWNMPAGAFKRCSGPT